MSLTHPKKGGRKSVEEITRMKQEAQFYFDRGISAEECHRRTGFNRSTCQAYYREFAEKLMELSRDGWADKQQQSKLRALLAMDKYIMEIMSVMQEINAKVLRNEIRAKINLSEDDKQKFNRSDLEPGQLFWKERERVAKTLFELVDKKHALLMSPTLKDSVEEEVQKILQRHGFTSTPEKS